MMHAQIKGQTGLTSGPPARCVALLVDGENISQDHANQIIIRAAALGTLVVKRVYGNAAKLPKWDSAPGFRLIHSGTGKNATDLLLSVEAVSLCHEAKIDTVVIASSDRDFSHLGHHLRERGIAVFGIGEPKAPETFRKACDRFIELTPRVVVVPATQTPLPKGPVDLDRLVERLIAGSDTVKGFPISLLGVKMNTQHAVTCVALSEGNWRAFLEARPGKFACDAKGPAARVRLVQSATP